MRSVRSAIWTSAEPVSVSESLLGDRGGHPACVRSNLLRSGNIPNPIRRVRGYHGPRSTALISRWGPLPHSFDVAVHLGDQIVDVVESLLTAEPVREADASRLAVEVAVEIEDIGLDQRQARLRVEGGAPTDGDRRESRHAVGGREHSRVHAIGGQADVLGNAHVRGRETEQAAARVAVLDRPAHFVRTPEHRGRAGDVARGEQLADSGRGVGHAGVAIECGDETQSDCLEAELRAHQLEQRDVAVAAITEMKIRTDHYEPSVQRAREELLDELLRRFLASRGVERQDETLVDVARRLEQLDLLLEGRQQLRRRVGPNDLGRVAIEREHRGGESAGPRELPHQPQHRLVTEMHAVERADRHRAPALVVRDLRRVAVDLHESAASVASTTDGLTPPPRRS